MKTCASGNLLKPQTSTRNRRRAFVKIAVNIFLLRNEEKISERFIFIKVFGENEIFLSEGKVFLTRAVEGCLAGYFLLLLVSNKQFYHKVFAGKANIATAFNVTAQFTKHKIFHLGKHFADE